MLPDFTDSEVSAQLGQTEDKRESEERVPESVQLTTRLEVEDEELRTKFRSDSPKGAAPAWRDCDDAIMDKAISDEETDWRVREWLAQEDVESEHGTHAEPMTRANHGASDQPACDRLWRHAQHQADRYGKPRIPIKPSVKGPPDVESQAAKRRGLCAEH